MGKVLGREVSGAFAVKSGDWVELLGGRLAGLGIAYDEQAPRRLARYHEMLCDWNTRMNLTGDTDFETALDRHYTDSLAGLCHVDLFAPGVSVIDVGSGAGFPGLPLKIARPDLQVTLLDSLAKRVAFLDAVISELGLTEIRTVHCRAEDGARQECHREYYHVAVARAVAPLPVLCELMLPYVAVGGKMLCYKGPAASEELAEGDRAARAVGGEPFQMLPITLPSQPEWRHCLYVSEKNQKTVRQYPRKAGVPSRLPLGKTDEISE